MRTEDAIREALERAASTHRIDPVLRRSTLVKARASRALTVVATATAVAALVVGGAGVVDAVREGETRVTPGSGGPSASEGPRQTDDTPLLLVLEDGWRVSRADQYSLTEGEMTFTNGARELELTWRPAASHEDYVADRADGATDLGAIDIARRHGKLFQYEGTTDFTALWLDGDLSLELRGVFSDVEAYRAVARTLDRVDEQTWLAALPDDTVVPEDRAAVVDEMLVDVPLHPEARLDRLKESPTASDRYQLGAQVTSAVACAWIDQWVDAQTSSDEKKAREAVDAMSTARKWPILIQMKDQGGWSEVLWEYADAMAGEGEVMGGRPLTVAGSYREGLGCPNGG